MTILFLDQFGALGGAQGCLLDLLPAVIARGWTAVVAAPDDGPLLVRARSLGAEGVALRFGPFRSGRKSPIDALRFAWQFPALLRVIQKTIDEHRVDMIYVNGPRLVPAASYLRDRLPVVFHCHSAFPGALPLVGRRLRAARATVIANCRFVAEPLAPWVPPECMHVVYNGVDDMATTHVGGRVGVIGRISPEKGQHLFVEAAYLLRGRANFVLCGVSASNDPAYQLKVVGASIIDAQVDLEAWTYDLRSLLASLDILVVPSLADATTRVIPEAFSAGVPVVAFATGGIPEIVDDGVTGLLAPSRTAAALAARIGELLDSPDLRARLAAAARLAYERRFTLSRWRRDIVGILERLQQQSKQQARAGRRDPRRS